MWYKVYYEGFDLIEADSEEEAIESRGNSTAIYGEEISTHAVPLDPIEDDELWEFTEDSK